MSTLGSFLLNKDALDAFGLTQEESDHFELCVLPWGYQMTAENKCVGVVQNHSFRSIHTLTLVKCKDGDSSLLPAETEMTSVEFKPMDDLLHMKKHETHVVLIADVCENAYGVSVNMDQFLTFVSTENTGVSSSAADDGPGSKICDSDDELNDEVVQYLKSVAEEADTSVPKRQKRRKIADVMIGTQGILKPRAAADAAQLWMEKHAGSFVQIDWVPQRGENDQDKKLRRYQVHDVVKDKMVTVRTLPECLDMVMSKVGRNFWDDMKNQPDQYNLSFQNKDFASGVASGITNGGVGQ